MTQRISTALANEIATLIADTFSDGLLEVYSGTPGATPDVTTGGTLLCEVLLPAVAFATASGGAVAMAGEWFGTVYTSGAAAWGRFKNRADDRHLVVTLSAAGGGGEITIDSTTLTEGGVLSIASFSYQVPLS